MTGVPALYLNELCLAGTVGAEYDRSVVESLLQHATEPRFVYRHLWEAGDVLVWDNRSVMHRATPIGEGCVREVHRVTSRYEDARPSASERR
jgi:alpha-ketoglutarate-dependent taurine dioxygenase